MNMDVITLLGYMGSGKSTFGKLVSRDLGYNFIDLDDYIVEKVGISIPDIFEKEGEEWFRTVETKYLKVLLESDKLLLSLGGGTPVHNSNMELVNEKSKSIYLNASVDTLYNYLKVNRSKRPIIRDLSNFELKEFISKHLKSRRAFYESAMFSVVIDNKSFMGIVEEIKDITRH